MLELKFSSFGRSTQICAKIPRSYPDTPFAQFCRAKHDDCFGYLQMSFLDKNSLSETFDNEKRYNLPWNVHYNSWKDVHIPIIFVHMILVHSQSPEGSHLCTADEKRMLKGLGVRMMCAAISSIADKIDDYRSAFVMLEADGAREDATSAAKQNYGNMSDKDLLMELFNKYPTELQDRIPDKQRELRTSTPRDFLLSMLCRTEANILLMKYYQKVYGLEVWQQSPTSKACLMGTTVDITMRHCHERLDLSD